MNDGISCGTAATSKKYIVRALRPSNALAETETYRGIVLSVAAYPYLRLIEPAKAERVRRKGVLLHGLGQRTCSGHRRRMWLARRRKAR